MRGYPYFSLWIGIAVAKKLLFPRGPNMAQKSFVFSRHRP